jgi:ribose transport system substrate-binding protein
MRTPIVAFVPVLLVAGFGCRTPEPAARAPIVLVVPLGSTQDYWKTIRVGASEEARRLGVAFQWPSAFDESNLESQWMILDQARAMAEAERRALAVALAPLDREAFVEPASILQDNGIPVVVFDTDLAGDDFLTAFSTDNEQAGRAAGEEMARQLGGRGNVAVLRVNPISQSTKLREKGFLEFMAQQPGITVVSKDFYASSLVERAFQQGLALLEQMASRGILLDGVFCPNESTSTGMLRALESRRLAGRVKLVAFDRTQRLVNALWHGRIAALVVQDPYDMGRRSVRALVEYLAVAQELGPLRHVDPAEYHRRVRAMFPRTSPIAYRIATRQDMAHSRDVASAMGVTTIGPYQVSALVARSTPVDADAIELLRLLFPKVAVAH